MKKRLKTIYWIGIICTLIMATIAVSLLVAFRIKDKSDSLSAVLETASEWTLVTNNDLKTHACHIASVSPPLRVTFLTDCGVVLADSEEEADVMDNHLDRPEIQSALRGEIGESLRLSDTQSIFMLYAAKRISENLILRLSFPIMIITRVVILYTIGIILLFFILIIFQKLAISHFTNSVTTQLDDVRRTLEGEIETPKAVFGEFQPALNNIAYQAKRLNSDLEEVRRTLSMRSDFVANASHELRSPLTSVMGFAEMLDEGLAETQEEKKMCIQTIRSECSRMLNVVEDVLLLSRAEREKDLVYKEVSVHEVAKEISKALSPQAAEKEIDIRIEGNLCLYSVEKDIWEILYNLTSNAIRYGKKGGWVKIRLKKNEISVFDNGIGIDEMHLPHLFEQFYRVDQSRDPSVRGTGLGLSIVRTLTERNGGNVSVKSEPGKGSEFTVTFTKNTQSD
ncbi:MAG: hypothetical protein IJD86_09310 [Clostridia bacterium]|nr:hypothetical protein [Clostridia bacterium]